MNTLVDMHLVKYETGNQLLFISVETSAQLMSWPEQIEQVLAVTAPVNLRVFPQAEQLSCRLRRVIAVLQCM